MAKTDQPSILNGEPLAAEAQLASLALYGNATFTSMVVEQGRVKGLDWHLHRLQQDARNTFGIEVDADLILSNIRALLAGQDASTNTIVRVTLFPKEFDMVRPELAQELNIWVTGRPAVAPSGALRCKIVETQRSLPTNKSVNMISIFKARRVARTAGFDDALLADEQHITEGATWNVFFIQQRELVTPPLAGDILPGVTRQLILDYCQQQGISVLQQPINRDQIQTFDGAFATNASWGVRPIAAIDDVQYSKTTSALMTQLCSFYDQLAGEFI